MRITSGIFRSRIIKAPSGIRPTLDNVRKAIFDILGVMVEGAEVLDLFAGSGALGFEAISRGASYCLFADSSPSSIAAIKANADSLGTGKTGKTGIFRQDASRAIEAAGRQGKHFDLIFLDPPYYKDLAKKSLSLLGNCDILTETGVVVIEHSKHDKMPESSGTLRLFRTARYGDTLVSFYRKDQKKS